MINVSHITCVVFGLGIAGFSIMLHYVGVNMTWFGYFIPMAICPGVIPLIFTVTWDRQTFGQHLFLQLLDLLQVNGVDFDGISLLWISHN